MSGRRTLQAWTNSYEGFSDLSSSAASILTLSGSGYGSTDITTNRRGIQLSLTSSNIGNDDRDEEVRIDYENLSKTPNRLSSSDSMCQVVPETPTCSVTNDDEDLTKSVPETPDFDRFIAEILSPHIKQTKSVNVFSDYQTSTQSVFTPKRSSYVPSSPKCDEKDEQTPKSPQTTLPQYKTSLSSKPITTFSGSKRLHRPPVARTLISTKQPDIEKSSLETRMDVQHFQPLSPCRLDVAEDPVFNKEIKMNDGHACVNDEDDVSLFSSVNSSQLHCPSQVIESIKSEDAIDGLDSSFSYFTQEKTVISNDVEGDQTDESFTQSALPFSLNQTPSIHGQIVTGEPDYGKRSKKEKLLDSVKAKKFVKGGLAEKLTKIIKCEQSDYAIQRHDKTIPSDSVCVSASKPALHLVVLEKLDGNILKCHIVYENMAAVDKEQCILMALSLNTERYDVSVNDRIVIHGQWQSLNVKNLGKVILTSAYCELIKVSEEVETELEQTTIEVGSKCCPCARDATCSGLSEYTGVYSFLSHQ